MDKTKVTCGADNTVREEKKYHLDEQSNCGGGSGNGSMTMGDGTVNEMMIRNDEGGVVVMIRRVR